MRLNREVFAKVKPLTNHLKELEEMSHHSESFFKYFRILLWLGGMYPGRRPGEKFSISVLKKLFIAFILVIYLGVVLVFLSAAYVRFNDSKDITRLIAFSLVFLTSLYISSVHSYILPNSLHELEKAYFSYEERYGFKPTFIKWIKRVKTATIVLPIFIVAVSPGLTVMNKIAPEFACDLFPACSFSEQWETVGNAITYAGFTSLSIQWQGILIAFSVLAYHLRGEFQNNGKMFRELEKSGSEDRARKLERCLEHHGSLMVMLNKASDCVQHYTFVSLFMFLPLLCSFLYSTIVKPEGNELVWFSFGMLWAVFMVGTRLLLEASVSVKAHEPLQYVWLMKMDNLSDRAVQKLNMFVSRLTGDSIGYSIYGLLTINMPTLLGITGTLVSYVIIVVQFHPKDSSSQCEMLMRNITYCIQP